MNNHPVMNVSITVREAAIDASEVAKRLASSVPMSAFDAER
jgi:hypothetical protein